MKKRILHGIGTPEAFIRRRFGKDHISDMESGEIAAMIDHTLLKPEATDADIVRLCSEAVTHGFASVCVQPSWVRLAYRELGKKGRVCSVIGFPHGANIRRIKAFEAEAAVNQGAHEIDMVQNIGLVKSGSLKRLRKEIRAVRKAIGKDIVLKVILETCLLTDDEIIECCRICAEIGVDFVKTSTGFSHGGATKHVVALMRKSVGDALGVKASGGIKSFADAIEMIRSGATRLGTSSGTAILSGQKISAQTY